MDCHRPQIFSAPALRMGRRGGRVLGTACSLCQRPSRSRDGMRRVLAPPSRRRRAGGGRPSPRIWTRPHAPSGRVSGRHFVNRPCSAGGPLERQHQVCGNPTSATFRMFGAGMIITSRNATPSLSRNTAHRCTYSRGTRRHWSHLDYGTCRRPTGYSDRRHCPSPEERRAESLPCAPSCARA